MTLLITTALLLYDLMPVNQAFRADGDDKVDVPLFVDDEFR
jgi:hypothetical protein